MEQKYIDYLKTLGWKDKVEKVMYRERFMCQGCLEVRATQVHHLTYEHIYDELLCELVALCESCHKKTHGLNKNV